ncbi:hypothetical protein D3C76_645980 [compost metagenome]
MEPVGAHGFAPVAANLDRAVLAGLAAGAHVVGPQGFAWRARERRAWIMGVGVDAVVAGQLDRPAIVVVLPGEEKRVGIPVAFRRRVAVVFVGADGVQAKAHVGRRIDRQAVVVAHQHRLAVAHHQQLGRQGAIEGPHRVVVLHRHIGVKTCIDAFGRAVRCRYAGDVVIQATGAELAHGIAVHLPDVTQATVDPRAGLHGLVGILRIELVPALVGPALSWRTAFGGRANMAVEEVLDLRLPRVAIHHVGVLAGERGQPGLAQEGIECGSRRCTAGRAVGVLRR